MFLTGWLLACGSGTEPGEASDEGTLEHRPEPASCGERPLPEEPACSGDAYDACAVHADCTDGDAGTCSTRSEGCVCGYDACRTDDDCTSGSVCNCVDPTVEFYGSPNNDCVVAGCSLDADCPSGRCQADHGFYCGIAQPGAATAITGWQCTSDADTCNGDEDCTDGYDRCMFSEGAFRCSTDYASICD